MNLNGIINYYNAYENKTFLIDIVFNTIDKIFYFKDQELFDELYEELKNVRFSFEVEFNKEHFMLKGKYLEDGYFEAQDDKYLKNLMVAINYNELNKELDSTNNVSKNKKKI